MLSKIQFEFRGLVFAKGFFVCLNDCVAKILGLCNVDCCNQILLIAVGIVVCRDVRSTRFHGSFKDRFELQLGFQSVGRTVVARLLLGKFLCVVVERQEVVIE